MRIKFIGLAGIFACLAITTVYAGVLIPVPQVKGSASTQAFGINNNNVIVGTWHDKKGVEHAFYGTLDGTYTTFDYTAAAVKGTGAFGIDDDNNIVGTAVPKSSDCGGGYPFFRKPNGTILTISRKGATTLGFLPGISDGKAVGSYYIEQACHSFGMLVENGKYKSDLPLGNNAFAAGINRSGVIVGTFFGGDKNFHGYRLQNGTMTQIDFPNAKEEETFLYAINDNGTVVGDWEDAKFNDHGFVLDLATNTFTALTVPGVTAPQSAGINNKGFLVVTANTGETFVYCPLKASKCAAKGKAMSIYGRSIRPAPGNTLRYLSSRHD